MIRTAIIIIIPALFLLVAACKEKDDRPITRGGPSPQQILDADKQVKMLESILEKDAGNLNALIKLGNIYMDGRRFQDAVGTYAKALEIEPTNVDVRVDMGTCYRRMGRSDKAVEEYKRAISINPRHPNAHLNLAVVLLYDFGQKEEAVREFEKFLEIAPTAPQAQTIREEVERVKATLQAAPQPSP
jgi:tetratricopeptide (TPR) repeat protein